MAGFWPDGQLRLQLVPLIDYQHATGPTRMQNLQSKKHNGLEEVTKYEHCEETDTIYYNPTIYMNRCVQFNMCKHPGD